MNERAEVRKRESADRGEGRDSEGATTALAPRVARGHTQRRKEWGGVQQIQHNIFWPKRGGNCFALRRRGLLPIITTISRLLGRIFRMGELVV